MAALGTHLRSSNNPGGVSRLSMMQARFREQLMLEKESRLLQMAARQDAEREDIINRVTKTSASSSLSSSMSSLNSSGAGQGRVRKMFQERRNIGKGYHHSPKGIDKSRPLEPVRRDITKGDPRFGRGLSMDRGLNQHTEDLGMPRSRSNVTLQRQYKGDNRVQKPPKGPTSRKGLQSHHKSTSSLMDNNYGYNGNSRGPSPGPPSSTKSSPGPRGPPVPPPRRNATRKLTNDNYLGVNGNINPKSRSPSPSPRNPDSDKGFFAKMGFNKSSQKPANPPKPKPPTKSKLSVQSNRDNALTPVNTPRQARSPVPANLRQCKLCGRNFDQDRIKKHEEICAKSKAKQKKRKVFDPVKMRTEGTEAEKFVARGDHLKEDKKAKKNNWRKKHEDFIKTVRAAKGVQGYVAPPIDTSDYVECPHCSRKFSEQVADRHIPKCANISSNKAGRNQGPPARAPAGRRR